MDKFTRNTTPEERAMDYARGVKYVGGEIQLAMQAAVMGAFIEGRKDAIEETRREQPVRVTDEMREKLAREIADDVFAGTKYNFGTDPRTRFAIRDILEAAAYAGLAAAPKEGEK